MTTQPGWLRDGLSCCLRAPWRCSPSRPHPPRRTPLPGPDRAPARGLANDRAPGRHLHPLPGERARLLAGSGDLQDLVGDRQHPCDAWLGTARYLPPGSGDGRRASDLLTRRAGGAAWRHQRRLLRLHHPFRLPQQRHAGEGQEDLQLRLGRPGGRVSPGRRLQDRQATGAAGQAEAPQPADRDGRRVRRSAGRQRPGRCVRHRRNRGHGADGVCGVHGQLDRVSYDAQRQPHLAQPDRARQIRAGGRVRLR